jgi:putative Mg2+ transporter-C (MgtC) family protein
MERLSFLHLSLRLLAAVIAGGLLGLNRVLLGKPTGFRTLALVSLGSALATLAVAQGGERLGVGIDPNALSRVVQGVLTGIGFLGAGVILRDSGGHITGLTTAATIWTTSLLGIFCGLGLWPLAAFSTLLAWGILRGGVAIERFAERFFKTENPQPPESEMRMQ